MTVKRMIHAMARWPWLVLGLLLTTQVQAQDLLGIFRQAREADPVYRAAAAERLATLEARPQARALLLPNLSISASYTDIREDLSVTAFGTPGVQTYDSTRYSLNLNQAIYHHDYFAQLRQAEAQVAQAEIRFRDAMQDLLLRTATAYFDVLAANDSLAFAESEKTAIGEQLHQTRQRFNVGLTAITDVHEAQARYDQAVAREIAARNALEVAQEVLRELTGQLPAELSTLKAGAPLVNPEPDDIDAWVTRALEQNMTLLAAFKDMDITLAEISRQRAGHLPSLDFVASYAYSDNGGIFFREATETRIGLQLNIPLYAGGGVSSALRQALHRHEAARERLEGVRRATVRQVRNAFLSVIAGISQVKALKQARASSETALAATRAGFEVGTRTAVDVLNSQRELYLAERNYSRARYDYLLDTLRLKQAAGILSEADIAQINGWLE